MAWFDWLRGTKKVTLKESVDYGMLPGIPAAGYDLWNFRPDQDGFLPIGLYRKRSKLGDNPQAYLNLEQLRMVREESRLLCTKNEYARNGLTNRRNYIVGTGFKTIAEPRDEENANEDLIKQVNDFLQEFSVVNKRAEKEKEAVFRGDRDGEVFLRLFADDGVLRFRFVEPEFVGDWDGQTPFGIKHDPKDVTNVKGYLVKYNESDEAELVPANEMIHVKLNSDSGILRGLPFLYPVHSILRKIESTNENMATNVAIMASIAMIKKNPYQTKGSIDTDNSNTADFRMPNPITGGSDNFRMYRPGSILRSDSNTEYEFPANGINLGGVVGVKESLLQTAAAGMGLPEYMLTSDCSNGNLSTTQVGESPMILGMASQQHFWGDAFGQGVYVEGADHGLTWRAIEHAIGVKRLPEETLLAISLKFEGPNVVVRDQIQETNRLKILADDGIISRNVWAQKEGEDKAAVSDEDRQKQKDAETQASQGHEIKMAQMKGQAKQKPPG